jgi:hypothetical protein
MSLVKKNDSRASIAQEQRMFLNMCPDGLLQDGDLLMDAN